MYSVKIDIVDKLKKSKLIDMSDAYTIEDSSFDGQTCPGYNETDLIISMQNNVEIETNYNFKEIRRGGLKIGDLKIILEKGTNYIFEIKTSIKPILANIQTIKKHQARFIEALKNVKVDNEDKDSDKDKEFIEILMCDNNPLIAEKEAKEKESQLNNKILIYSGVQIGITFINRLNNNIRNLNKELDKQNKKILDLEDLSNIQNKEIADLKEQNKS